MTARPDAYPLTPMQQGILFHSVSGEADAVYVHQLCLAIYGSLDARAFTAAWQTLQERHAVLRTAFAWRGLPEPLQVVGQRARLPLEILDWQDRADPAELATLRAEERARGFELNRAPLFRLVLVHLYDDEYRLVWTWHHAILDAWSVPILLKELLAGYGEHARGRPPELAPVRPFKDFVAWQRAQPSAEAWWKERLRGFTEPTPLTIEHVARDPRSELGYGLEFVPMSPDEVAALKAAARRRRVTLNTLAQGAWALLLSRYSGRRDVVFGTAVAGRPPELDGIEQMVGITLNTLPVRVQLDPDRELESWLVELQHQQVEGRLREHVSLSQVQSWSEVPGGTRLFDSLLVFENFPLDLQSLQASDELRVGDFEFVERGGFPLVVMLEIRDTGRLGGGWDEDRFDRGTVRRLLGHMRRLLAQMCAAEPRRLRDLTVVDAEEAAELLALSRGERPLEGTPRTLHELVQARGSASPEATAMVFAGLEDGAISSISYRELVAQASAIAGRLVRAGVCRGDRVVVSMRASILRLATVLGVLQAGAAYVPVEPSFPQIRLTEIIADSRATHVLVDADDPRAQVSGVTRVGPGFELPDGPPVAVEVDVDDLAYLIYTSGSTGRPKGVAVTHRSADHLVRSQIEAFRIDAGSRVLQFASLSWDASVSEIFTALGAGACLVSAPRHRLVPSREMVDLIERLGVTHATLPPSVLAQLPVAPLPALRTLVSAGEPCSVDIVKTWAPGRLFLNAYGPTETTVCASLGPADPSSDRPPSIGRPLGDARVYIIDDELRPVPLGVVGELCVGGPGVARGYWGRPEQTAAAFVEDPFAGVGMQMYRTGDLARFLADGQIEFVGRRDQQLKLRGFRLDPGEIEAVLCEDPSVSAAAVDALGEESSARLVAWTIAKRDYPGPQWWPSIAEYLVYDELAYHAMSSDERRNESYRKALAGTVRDRVVLEVGPGPEAILSRLCVEAGARKVYAVELLRDTFEEASAHVRGLGLADVIEVIHADATAVELPEQAEVCVSEIVGAIGGCEGAAMIMNGVRRLLSPGARMVPERSVTLFAPVELPAALLAELAFDALPARYVERIFAEIGYPFDLRLSVRGLDYSHVLAAPRVFEELDFRAPVNPERHGAEEFEVQREGTLHGFLVWLTLDCGAGPVLDTLKHEHCWLPVFFPAFHPGVAVRAGDRISAHCRAELCEDRLHPDYGVDGTLYLQGAEPVPFRHDAPHHAPIFKATRLYAELFARDTVPRRSVPPRRGIDPDALLRRLRTRLPEHMIPAEVRVVDELPLADSGKLDRKALRGLGFHRARPVADDTPRNEAELLVASIWRDLLGIERVGLRTNFFDEGGHSLLLIEVQERLRQAGVEVLVTDLFEFPTVELLAGHLSRAKPTDVRTEGAEKAAARRSALAARRESLASRGAAGPRGIPRRSR
ncbi:amino acid adenylation domain-containing protein [Sorangium sp. So ce375]|uniref:amino acid adenylation domain-containing protein n=1 Tax=Sorangium sp. So ce375 TaxID=3133306 RepID=UPI003F5B04D1